MVSSISKLTVYNMALGLLEQEPIVSLSSDSANTKILNNNYELALRTCLKGRAWDFATTFATLTLISDAANLSGYAYLYSLPNDFLEFQKVYDTDNEDVEYIRTSDGIYSDASPCYIRYTKFIETYSQFDEDFIHLLAYTLAEMSTGEILGDTQKQDYLSKKADRLEAIAASKSVGRTQVRYDISKGSSFLNDRY